MQYALRSFYGMALMTLGLASPAQTPPPSRWIQGIGYLEPVSEVRRLAFKHPGILADYRVQIGQTVKAGEVLAIQNNSEEKTAVQVAESKLVSAKANRDKVLAGVNPYEIQAKKHAQAFAALETEYAERKLKRVAQLEHDRFATEDEHDLAETSVALKRAENQRLLSEINNLNHFIREVDKQALQGEVAVAEASLQAAQQRLAQTQLLAPIDGTILEVIRQVGESTYEAGSPEPVLLFGDLSKMRVRAEIDENYALALRNGQKAVLFGRGLGEREVAAKVAFVKPVMGKKTVFTKSATERKDIDVIQLFIEPEQPLQLPVGLEVNVKIALDPP